MRRSTRRPRRVGRDPREIRRLLNVGQLAADPAEFAERLAALAIEDGIGTFILAGDDPRLLQSVRRRGRAGGARARGERERAERGTAAASVRSSRRSPPGATGIAYDDVPAGLRAIEPGDFDYADVRSDLHARRLARASCCSPTRPRRWPRRSRSRGGIRMLALAVRSGGHGISGRSTNDGGIVIDLRRLNEIEVLDEERRLVRIGPGARWMEVAAALGEHGWALSSGDYGGVGVGGLATAGGIGFLAREHGLTIDHLRAAEVVLADGTIVRTDAATRPDLFWAVRGAGANVGIVTALRVRGRRGRRDRLGAARVRGRRTPRSSSWATAAIVEAAPRDLTAFLLMGGTRPGQPRIAQRHGDGRLGRPRHDHRAAAALRRARAARAAVGHADDVPAGHGQRRPRAAARQRRAALALGAARAHHARVRAGGDRDDGCRWLVLLPVPLGRRARCRTCPRTRRSYSHRSANFSVVALGANSDRLDASWEAVAAHGQGMYLSFDTSLRPERIAEAFPPATLERLRAIKAEVDPDGLFGDNFCAVDASRSEPASVLDRPAESIRLREAGMRTAGIECTSASVARIARRHSCEGSAPTERGSTVRMSTMESPSRDSHAELPRTSPIRTR